MSNMNILVKIILLFTMFSQCGMVGSAQNSRFKTNVKRQTVCKILDKTLILPKNVSRSKQLFLITAVFKLYKTKNPNWEENMMAYLSFRSNLDKFVKSQSLQWGAVLYESTCYRNEIQIVIMDILLSQLVNHPDYKIVAVFTEDLDKLPSSASILLPYGIPIYVVSINNNKHSTFNNFNPTLRASIVIQRNLQNMRQKIKNFLKRSTYGEVILFRGSDLSLPEDNQLDRMLEEFNQEKICVVGNLIIPNSWRGWKQLNFTMRHIHTSNLYVVYSHFKYELTKITNLVHATKPNQTITWIFSRSYNKNKMSRESIQYANIIYMRSFVLPSRKYSKVHLKRYLERKASEDVWVKLYVKRKYLPKPISKIIHMSSYLLDKTYFFVFQKIGSAFKKWEPSKGMENIYKAIKKMRIPGFISNFIGVIKDSNGNRRQVNDLNKNIHILMSNSTKLCHKECDNGYGRVLINNFVSCCWRCEKCPNGHYRTINMTRCQACPSNTMSDNKRNQCFSYRIKSIEYKPVMVSLCSTLTGLGIVASLTIAFVFFRYRETPLVKSSDKNLLSLHLTSHIALLLIQLATFVPTDKRLCYVQVLVTGSLWSLSSSVTLVKTQKFLRIFNSDVRQTAKEVTLTKYLILGTIFLGQIPSILLTVLSASYIKDILEITRDENTIIEYQKCNLHPYHTVVLLYVELLLLACIIQGYRARKLPTNFNETKYIITAVASAEVFILSYMIGGQDNMLIEYTFLWFANICTVFFMYGYKTFVIFFRPHLNNAKYMNMQLMERSNKKANNIRFK